MTPTVEAALSDVCRPDLPLHVRVKARNVLRAEIERLVSECEQWARNWSRCQTCGAEAGVLSVPFCESCFNEFENDADEEP